LYRLRMDEAALRKRNVNAKPTEYIRKLEEQQRIEASKQQMLQPTTQDTSHRQNDFFNSEFSNEKRDSSQLGRVFEAQDITEETVLSKAKLYEYRPPKFFNDYVVAGLNNTVFAPSKYMPYQHGAGPVRPANGSDLNGLIRLGTVDLFEDYKISGGIRIAPNLRDNDVLFEFMNLKKRWDWGMTYYRSTTKIEFEQDPNNPSSFIPPRKVFATYYLARLNYAFDRVKSIRATIGPRYDRTTFITPFGLDAPDEKHTYGQLSLEYVYDNSLNKTLNIWNGLRYKVYVDWFAQVNQLKTAEGRNLFNVGFDARHYYPLYRNVIWALRAAGDFSWGDQKVIYYLGGTDGWISPKFNSANPPDPDQDYAYETLALNLRGFKQNTANGNNNVVINSEVRAPLFSTLFNRPINNAFLRNFQLVQFFDLGTAWNGKYDKIERPHVIYSDNQNPNVLVKIKAGGIGPFAGSYGFGARSTLLGYFVRFDAAWGMDVFFKGKPMMTVSLGVDF
ncbi:MAG TPA: hypothetical protein VL095_03470, partial [Flavisolibacter sp.]|nr:hypothetical protein [Flavisolibacter sp.]